MIIFLSKKRIFCGAFIVLAITLFFASGYKRMMRSIMTSETDEKKYIAIVIDDFGYEGAGTEEMLALDVPITAGILPFSPNSAEDAAKADEAGVEYIIHMPMESTWGDPSWVGDKGIFLDMTPEESEQVTREAFDILSGAVGLSNHMGSAITSNKEALMPVLSVVAEKGLIFLDSGTTENPVSPEICSELEMSCLSRDIFIDGTQNIDIIREQIYRAGDIAERKGYAIAIGHVGPEGGAVTAEAIEQVAPMLERRGIEFVTLTELEEILRNR